MSFYNKRSRGPIKFDFSVNGRIISQKEVIIINLGGIGSDNAINLNNIICYVKEGNSLSYLWQTLDMSNLLAI